MMHKNKNIQIIFSDESGRWADGPYYVRSWIFWNIENYLQIERKYTEKLNRQKHLLEWKNKRLKTILDKKSVEEIFQNIDRMFFTFTIIKEFKERKLNVRSDINQLLNVHPSLEGKKYKKYLINNVGKAVNKTYFLYLYENMHFKSFFDKLNDSSVYILMIDKPSQLDPKQHRKILMESPFIENKKVILGESDSDLSLGLQVADCFAGMVNDFLKNAVKESESWLCKYKEKFFDDKSINKIMWQGDDDYQLKEIKRINTFFNKK